MSKKDKEQSSSGKWNMGMDSVKIDLRRAIIGGSVSAIVIMIGAWLVGEASNSEAFHLFKAALPSTLSFCENLSLALGNILALMLTLLSLSASLDIDIKWEHYQRVKQISWVVTVTLIVTILVMLLLNIPIVESEEKRILWFSTIYYATLFVSAVLGGAFITIVLLLYNTVRDMIGVLDPKSEHHLHEIQDEEE